VWHDPSMKRIILLFAVVLAAWSAPAASAWRAPTLNEKNRIVSALPRFYHQACIRYSIRVSSVDNRFGAVFFRFVHPTAKGCNPFDGQVLVKRVTTVRWQKIGEGSEWPCRIKGVSTRVIKDLFGSCAP
jgi:hypothetical protein